MAGFVDRVPDGYRFAVKRGEVASIVFAMALRHISESLVIEKKDVVVHVGTERIAVESKDKRGMMFECYERVELGRYPDKFVRTLGEAIAWCAGDLS